MEWWMPALIFGCSFLGLGVAVYFARYVLSQSTGTMKMREIAGAIKEGANAFLYRQYKTIYMIAGIFAMVIPVSYTHLTLPTKRIV